MALLCIMDGRMTTPPFPDSERVPQKQQPQKAFPAEVKTKAKGHLNISEGGRDHSDADRCHHYTEFQKEIYNFESLYKFIQRTCTVFWTVIT
jgi:hypothetical protein